jgi:hypothetical protein
VVRTSSDGATLLDKIEIDCGRAVRRPIRISVRRRGVSPAFQVHEMHDVGTLQRQTGKRVSISRRIVGRNFSLHSLVPSSDGPKRPSQPEPPPPKSEPAIVETINRTQSTVTTIKTMNQPQCGRLIVPGAMSHSDSVALRIGEGRVWEGERIAPGSDHDDGHGHE